MQTLMISTGDKKFTAIFNVEFINDNEAVAKHLTVTSKETDNKYLVHSLIKLDANREYFSRELNLIESGLYTAFAMKAASMLQDEDVYLLKDGEATPLSEIDDTEYLQIMAALFGDTNK